MKSLRKTNPKVLALYHLSSNELGAPGSKGENLTQISHYWRILVL